MKYIVEVFRRSTNSWRKRGQFADIHKAIKKFDEIGKSIVKTDYNHVRLLKVEQIFQKQLTRGKNAST